MVQEKDAWCRKDKSMPWERISNLGNWEEQTEIEAQLVKLNIPSRS